MDRGHGVNAGDQSTRDEGRGEQRFQPSPAPAGSRFCLVHGFRGPMDNVEYNIGHLIARPALVINMDLAILLTFPAPFLQSGEAARCRPGERASDGCGFRLADTLPMRRREKAPGGQRSFSRTSSACWRSVPRWGEGSGGYSQVRTWTSTESCCPRLPS